MNHITQKELAQNYYLNAVANYPEALRLIVFRMYAELRSGDEYKDGSVSNTAFWYRTIHEMQKANSNWRPEHVRLITLAAVYAPHEEREKYSEDVLMFKAKFLNNSFKRFCKNEFRG